MEKARRSASRTGGRLWRIASSIFPWRRRGRSIWWGRGSRRCGWKSSATWIPPRDFSPRSEEHTSELQSHSDLVCRLLLEKKKKNKNKSNAIFKSTYHEWAKRA